MIQFCCSMCGKVYSVADEFAGRQSRCTVCATPLQVPKRPESKTDRIVISLPPAASPPAASPPAASPPIVPSAAPRANVPMRLRRLTAEAAQLSGAFSSSAIIRITSTQGNPPEHYQIEYAVRGLARGRDGLPQVRDHHVVEIQLTREYPRQSPKCKMLTPIFHPNIDPATICVGDHWTAGERLVDLVVRIGELISFQAYNIKSPLDGEAAMWADLNKSQLPIDARDLRPPDLEK